MKVLIVLAAALLGAQAVPDLDLKEQWDAFKLKYGKQYASQTEETFRMKIFAENLRENEAHNRRYEQGLVSYTRGVNQFTDLLHKEFVETYNGFNKSRLVQREDAKVVMLPDLELPDSVDWRNQGAVTPVKNQGRCLSCWSFSTTGAVEGQHFIKTGQLVSLSEQNLVDCSRPYGNNGCNEGNPDNAFKYIQANGGIDTEDSYRYEGQDGQCRYSPQNVGATITGYQKLPPGSEQQLQQAVATIGPISVLIDSHHDSFQHYQGDVYDEPACTQNLDHCVLVVGYGTTQDGKDYWIVKNSWAETWGEAGYIRMSRNKNNQCGIATQASYPVI